MATAEARGELILLAEDNAVNQQVGQRQRAWLGHPCLLAADGVEALELWRQHRIGLLLTDCHMPEMDGYTLARRIRELEATGASRVHPSSPSPPARWPATSSAVRRRAWMIT